MLHPGIGSINSSTTTGIAASLYDFRGGPRSTGKERDAESGLDYFGARYLASAQGRFTSPDGPFYDQDASDPQSWNLYSYVRNNPLTGTDPTGQDCQDSNNANPCFTVTAHASWFGRALGAIGNFLGSGTQTDEFTDARTNLAQMHGFSIGGKTPADIASSGTNQQVLSAYKSANQFLLGVAQNSLAPCSQGVSCGVALIGGDEFENLGDAKATVHVLQGDSTGGGHAPGLGIAGKSEFPAGWSNEQIMHNISDVATDPKSHVQKLGGTTIIEGSREGVDIKVVVRDGRIVTGYPTNTPRNP